MSVQDLLPITKQIYSQMVTIAWLMIGPLFLLSCVIEYSKEPHNFPAWELLRKLIITIVLLCFFPEISAAISITANALADRIGEKHALDILFQQIHDQTDPKSQASKMPFLLSADIQVAIMNYFSFAAVKLAKFIMIALYHFFWSLLMAVAPLMILGNLFRSASHLTGHLFGSLFEISSWNIAWQIMAEMLLGLNYLHADPSNYFDAVCFNFLLAIAMVGTPILIHSLLRQGLSSPSSVSAGGMMAFVGTPFRHAQTAMKMASGRSPLSGNSVSKKKED